MSKPLPTGATIGILGGGQLGRMLSVAASRLGFKTCIFEPGGDCPASHVAKSHIHASYDNADALRKFGESVDVITFEFENIPASALDQLETHCEVRPNRRALTISQDRLNEKAFLQGIDLTVAPFMAIDSLEDMHIAVDKVGAPSILKTRTLGYDGKGQARLRDAGDAEAAFAAMNGASAVLEGFVNFSCEISVIGARTADGQVACFDPGENVHRDGILDTTSVPASVSPAQRTDAVLMTGRILNALDYVGVLGVELFVTPAGLIVNEIAPRVHNSGHWTQNGCVIDQFEQHIRAVAGWPLGDGSRHADVVMENLIGADMDKVPELAADPAVALHLYGKADAKAGRKMGHINRISPKT